MKKLLLTLAVLLFAVSSRLSAQALPAMYRMDTIIQGLEYSVDFDWTPDGRYFITQKGGNSTGACANGKILVYSSAGVLLSTFYDLTDSVNCDFERGLLGIAIDPNFNTNHYVYVYYVHKWGTANSCRILRFTEASNLGTNATVILDISVNGLGFTPAGNHFGGIIRFRPNEPDKIYLQLGDLAYHQSGASANLNLANKLNKPFGKILRINSNGTIPTDNPYYDDGNPSTGNDDRIWTYGDRNGFGMCFNPNTDSMYFSENGLNTWDEFNIAHRGANYGWNTCEGNYQNSSTTVLCKTPTTSTSTLTVATGSQTLTVGTGLTSYTAGLMVLIANGANTMTGTITSYTSGTGALVVNVISVTGSGSASSWNITLNPTFINPLREWAAPVPSVTGVLFYTGTVMSEFNNHILLNDNNNGILHDLTMGNAPYYDAVSSQVNFAGITNNGVTGEGLTAIREGADGCIYTMVGGYTTNGRILRICHAPGVGIATSEAYENTIGQNYPNPTSGITQVDFSVAQTSSVSIDLFDVTGRKIKSLLNASDVAAGKHTVEINDLNSFANGSYFYKMIVKQNNQVVYSVTKRMLLVK